MMYFKLLCGGDIDVEDCTYSNRIYSSSTNIEYVYIDRWHQLIRVSDDEATAAFLAGKVVIPYDYVIFLYNRDKDSFEGVELP